MRFAAPDDLRAAWSEYHRLKAIGDELEYEVLNVHGDAGHALAARYLRAGKGRLSEPQRESDSRHPRRSAPAAQGQTAEPPHPGRVVSGPGEPAARPSGGESYWQLYFGTGIVKTVEDFGSQGEPPSHPELLDWLATEFVRTGWDVKAMQRLIVTSATYRQSSIHSGDEGARSGEPSARARSAVPAARRVGPRQRTGRERGSSITHRRTQRLSVSASWPWEEVAWRCLLVAEIWRKPWPRSVPAQHVHVLEADRVAAVPGTFDAPNREKCAARRSVTKHPCRRWYC